MPTIPTEYFANGNTRIDRHSWWLIAAADAGNGQANGEYIHQQVMLIKL